eukprot:m.19088 g.19088  ORF g.19088 m.19088 type:complete len:83 (-) comp7975_c0_seq2:858-1106(-)
MSHLFLSLSVSRSLLSFSFPLLVLALCMSLFSNISFQLSIGDDVGEYSLINPDGVLQKLKDIFGEAGGNASTVNVIACGSFT